MSFQSAELTEFKTEALELIDEAERNLLEVEQGLEFRSRFDAVFRCFHSLKGAAGMLALENLRQHMHQLEELFATFKEASVLAPPEITFFLEGIDASRKIIAGNTVVFKFDLPKLKIKTSTNQEKKSTDVFIIDDEPDLVEVLGGYMEKSKYSWKGFTDPVAAMKEFETDVPKLIVSDLRMPKLDGLGVLKRVRETSKDLPLIFISAQLSKEALLEAISQGISAVIEKPFREGQVIAQVRQTLYQTELRELLNSTIDVLMFQMPDLETFLVEKGKQEVLETFKKDVTLLLQKRRQLKQMTT